MMPVIRAAMLAVSSSPAASIVAKATVAAALGLLAAGLARRNRAAVRHALLAATFGVLLALPAASLVAPPVRIAVADAAPKRIAPAFPRAAGAIPAASARAGNGGAPAVPRSSPLSLTDLLLAGWIAGTALFLLPVLLGLWQVRRLRRSAFPWPHGQSALENLARDAGIPRHVEVLLDKTLPGPMTCGVLYPAIVLPAEAQDWAAEDLHRALVHELEHVRRGDWLSQSLARAVCAFYWFHPLVWIAWRRLALEAERSADDAVLGFSEATAYADQLVGLARRLASAAKTPLPAMANCADLATRVGAVLDVRQQRGRAGTRTVALACAAAAMLVLTISPLQTVAAPQSAGPGANAARIQIAVATNLVMEDVVVADQNGNPIEGLTAKDFVVTEDGAPQDISLLEFQKAEDSHNLFAGYYILGYYTRNSDVDGEFRTIKITCKADSIGKLDYRSGYYANRAWGPAARPIEPGAQAPEVDPGFKPPVLISKVEPAYSEEARKAKYQGTVLLSVVIDASGKVSEIRVVRSLGLGLDEKAVEAVRKWRFKPGSKDGQPVDVPVQVQVSFRLM